MSDAILENGCNHGAFPWLNCKKCFPNKDRIAELEAENARLLGIKCHTCHADCKLDGCENRKLRAALLKAEDILGFYATGGHDQGGYAEEALAEIRTAKGQL